MALSYVPVQKGKHVRVWFALNGLNPLEDPRLDGYMIPDAVSFNQTTDVVKKKVPSPTQRGKFETIYTVTQRSDVEITTSLIQRMPANMRSMFVKLASGGCKFDMIWAYGVCTNPNDFNDFDKLEVFEGVSAANYQHDTTGAFDESTLTDDVLETLEVTAERYYEVANVDVTTSGTHTGAAGTEYAAAAFVDQQGCGEQGDCSDSIRTDGTQRIVALAIPTAGFISINRTEDAGKNWTLIATDIPFSTAVGKIAVANGKVIITGNGVANNTVDYWHVSVDDVFAATTAVTTTAVEGADHGGANLVHVGATYIYFFGADGDITYLPLGSIGKAPITLIDAAGAPLSVSGIDDNVVFGNNAGTVYAINGLTYKTSVSGAAYASAVAYLGNNEFSVYGDTSCFYTKNNGTSFTEVELTAGVSSIKFANGAVGLACSADNDILYTANAGRSFTNKATFPQAEQVLLAADNGNFFVFSGTDGNTLVVAEDSLRQTYGAF